MWGKGALKALSAEGEIGRTTSCATHAETLPNEEARGLAARAREITARTPKPWFRWQRSQCTIECEERSIIC